MPAQYIVFVAELVGIIAFAISGVLVAIEHKLDLFGALVLGAVTSVGGGMTRDVLIGQTPPIMFTTPVYAGLAVAVSLVVFLLAYFSGSRINLHGQRLMQIVNFFDALGLGVFVTVGVDAVLAGEMADNGFLAIFIGTITGVGGGVLRDLFVATIPAIFRKHIYAIAAIFGSAVYYYMVTCGLPVAVALPTAVTAVVVIRLLATHYRWNMPHVPLPKEAAPPAPPSDEAR